MPASPAQLEVRGIGKLFGGLSALEEVSFTAPAGRLLGLIGPNGAGKSTLFNIIAGAFRPSRGAVLLDGRDVTPLGSAGRARMGIGRTFQLATLFHELSAMQNVLQAVLCRAPRRTLAGLLQSEAYRREQQACEARARQVLETLDIDAYWNQRAGGLPLGVRKLLTVAVALATEPRLLLLDEPAAGLSEEEGRRLMARIDATLRGRCTVIVVEHHLKLIQRFCEQVIVLEFGRVIYDGPPAGLKGNTRVVDAYLGHD